MYETGVKLLKLMFREGETICVSHNKYGYHSLPLENALSTQVTLVPPARPEDDTEAKWRERIEYVDTNEIRLVALNPIKGFRQDLNCTAFRNFLIEMDYGPVKQQLEYVKKQEMPYSAVIFSGGKSLHFLVSLDRDLPDEKTYRKIAEWILAIMTAADQNCKNPSRSIRVPGPKRDDSRQALVEMKGAVRLHDLAAWLNRYPQLMPKERAKREASGNIDFDRIRPWVVNALKSGLDPAKGRNKQWFAIACDFALAGYSEDDTIRILEQFFSPDRDFKEREWLTSIRSGFKYVYESRK
jgi:hypothetical protein